MGEDEKAIQIGKAVSEYQAAKVECAHIEKRIETIFQTYLAAGASMDRSKGSISEPKLVDGKIQIGWYGADRFNPAYLLNATDLATVLIERDKARSRLADARKAMNDLGITGVS